MKIVDQKQLGVTFPVNHFLIIGDALYMADELLKHVVEIWLAICDFLEQALGWNTTNSAKWSAQIECIGSEHHEKGSHNNVKKDIYACSKHIFLCMCKYILQNVCMKITEHFAAFYYCTRLGSGVESTAMTFPSPHLVVALHEFKGHRSIYSQEYSSEMSAYWDCHCSLLPFLVFQRSFLVGYGRIFQRGHILHLEHPVSRA